MTEQKDIIAWVKERMDFIDEQLEVAKNDGNYGKQVYLSAKREAYEELKRQLLITKKQAG